MNEISISFYYFTWNFEDNIKTQLIKTQYDMRILRIFSQVMEKAVE